MSEENVEVMRGALEAFAASDVFSDSGQDVRIKQPDIRDLGDRILALGTFEINWRTSGMDLDVPFGVVATIRGGLIVNLKDFGDRVLALEAAGL